MTSDYTDIWRVLNSGKHVLLLIDTQGDEDYFQIKTDDIRSWFDSIVKADLGPLDLQMQNGALLSLRKFRDMPAYPFDPEKEGIKVMWLRYGKAID